MNLLLFLALVTLSTLASIQASTDAKAEVILGWVWVGAATPEGALVSVRVNSTWDEDGEPLSPGWRIFASAWSVESVEIRQDGDDEEYRHRVNSVYEIDPEHIARLVFKGLLPQTNYEFEIKASLVDGNEVHVRMGDAAAHMGASVDAPVRGKFMTPPIPGTPFNFTFGAASCADNGSDTVVFDAIREHQPMFFLHTGDMHYGNIVRNDIEPFRQMQDWTLSSPRQSKFFRSMSVIYMWDDHDYGPNNSDKFSPAKDAALRSFLESVPYHQLPAYAMVDPAAVSRARTDAISLDASSSQDLPPVYYAFNVGQVRFIVTDLRSARGKKGTTVLGEQQLLWFQNELTRAAHAPVDQVSLVVWVSTMPWVSDSVKWGAYREEQQSIAGLIDTLGLSSRMLVVAGDAHMLAFDDGSNSPGGMPVFHAAALDAKPTSKGGPYSHGILPGRGQFGLVRIESRPTATVDGTTSMRTCFVISGRRIIKSEEKGNESYEDREVISYDSCQPDLYPGTPYIPSPSWVRTMWKTLKGMLARNPWLKDNVVIPIDSSSMSGRMMIGVVGKMLLPQSLLLLVATVLSVWMLGGVAQSDAVVTHGK